MGYEMNPVHRKIKLLMMIPREPNSITASTIHERFMDQGIEEDIRTIQRDLKKLMLDFPISYTKDKSTKAYHWFFIKESYPLDIPEMSRLIAFSFSLVETFLSGSLPSIITKQLDPHFRSAENLLMQLQSSSWVRWADKVRFAPKGYQLLPAEIDQDIFENVSEGVWRERQLKVIYHSREKQEDKEAIIHPLGLVFRFGIIYLLCTYWEYTNVVQLAIHRFKKVEVLSEPRTKPDDFTIDEYLKETGINIPLRDKPIKIKLLFDPDAAYHLYESKLSEDQQLKEQTDGRVLLTATVKETMELHWWLRGFGDLVEVIGPKNLRDGFAQTANSMAQLYAKR